MLRIVGQTGPAAPGALCPADTAAPVLHRITHSDRFSDPHHDPRLLMAVMVQTRQHCRSTGLIPRDIDELTQIGRTLGITPRDTQRIIDMVLDLPDTTFARDLTPESLPTLTHSGRQRKTRANARVLLSLGIWMLSIIVAIQLI